MRKKVYITQTEYNKASDALYLIDNTKDVDLEEYFLRKAMLNATCTDHEKEHCIEIMLKYDIISNFFNSIMDETVER